MVDEIKSPVSGSTTLPPSFSPSEPSPLSPQIKVPQPNQPPFTTPGGILPSNLPTGEFKPPTTTPPTIRPISPAFSLSPKPAAPMPTTPLTMPSKLAVPTPPSSVSKPTAQPLPPSQPPVSVFKSSIRTMQEDVAALKKGQAPVGFQMERESEKESKPAPIIPKVTMPPSPTSHVELGRLERSRPLPGVAPMPSVPKMAPPSVAPTLGSNKPTSSISVPSTGGASIFSSKRNVLIVVLGLVVIAGAVYWFVFLRGPATQVATPTPTPTPAPVPTGWTTVIESAWCTPETDGGDNVNVKGSTFAYQAFTKQRALEYVDYCDAQGRQVEYWCPPNGQQNGADVQRLLVKTAACPSGACPSGA